MFVYVIDICIIRLRMHFITLLIYHQNKIIIEAGNFILSNFIPSYTF